MTNPTLKEEIKSKLTPFLDSLTPEELSVFKWMVKKLRSNLISDTDGDSIETSVIEK